VHYDIPVDGSQVINLGEPAPYLNLTISYYNILHDTATFIITGSIREPNQDLLIDFNVKIQLDYNKKNTGEPNEAKAQLESVTIAGDDHMFTTPAA